jgi:hypothetical protein
MKNLIDRMLDTEPGALEILVITLVALWFVLG